ncbi:alpha/beta fold hydrolase [Nonomuraea phyllanthi]|uniref:alpha/beta hydrolase n=1 Tax=Nonomuraea phyllanthi TaxID=2219224 RepID=UPI0012937056|nr:alpha/beta hydrolase [Nonomuraea phyllanthi]QFY05393.1 alpha/beta fold hydrolase [Nonomuraea phyllanthi]
MHRVTAKDGTSIAYDRLGDGPAIILVGGAAADRSANAQLAQELADRFTVYTYDRRGRGDSGDTLPYAVEREIEDIAALIEAAGGAAHVFGASSGGALALEAAAAGLSIARLAVYEVPYAMEPGWLSYVERLRVLLADERRGDAFALFMVSAGATDEMVEQARESPEWPRMEALAPTLAYDAACLGDGRPPAERLARIACPTLVATCGTGSRPVAWGEPRHDAGPTGVRAAAAGSIAAHTSGSMAARISGAAADAIAAHVPGAVRETVEGQPHLVDAKAFAPVLAKFLGK